MGKCKEAVKKSEKSLKQQKEKVKKANEAADPYNQAELISKSVLKMKDMYHSEKAKEACAKKYKKLENEGHEKENESKTKMSTLKETMQATIEKAEKTQCKKTLKSSELSNKAEEKFWAG